MKHDVLAILHDMKRKTYKRDINYKIAVATSLKMNVQLLLNWLRHERTKDRELFRKRTGEFDIKQQTIY